MEKAIEKDYNDIRVDRWLFKNGLVNSFVEAQKMIRSGQIRLNGEKIKINSRAFEGDIITFPEIKVVKKEKNKYIATDQDKKSLLESVIYKDDNIIAINKPAGLSVQGGSGSFKNLDSMLDVLKFDKEVKPKLVHRLDKNTSGVLVIARNNTSAKKLQKWFKEKIIKKTYWAVVSGIPTNEEGVINAPLLKKSGNNEKVIVSPNGKESITKYKILEKYRDKACLLEVLPETGRTHQIRVHLNYIGYPIIGDGKYGGKKSYLKEFSEKMRLHAKSIDIPNIENNKKIITIEADAPKDFF